MPVFEKNIVHALTCKCLCERLQVAQHPPILDPLNHEWRKKGSILHSTYIPDGQLIAPEEVLNLIKCGCKTECKSAMCSSNVAGLSCTEFCNCKGNCANHFNVQHETSESDESCFESFDE